MKLKDVIQFKYKGEVIDEMIYFTEVKEQILVGKEIDLVDNTQPAILWVDNNVGSKKFYAIKKKHNYVKISEDLYELDIEPIDKNDL